MLTTKPNKMIEVNKYKSIDRGSDPNKEYYLNQNGTYISLTKTELEKIASDLKSLGVGDVSNSLLIPISTLKDWVDTLDSMEWSFNHRIYVKDYIEEFVKKAESNKIP